MDERTFDDLTRAAGATRSRRGTLGLLAAALAAVSLPIGPATARKKRGAKGNNRNKKRCRKLGQGCGKKKRCCQGLVCTDGACSCPGETLQSGGSCVPAPPPPAPPPPPPAPECTVNGDCGANEICQNGECVPKPPECVKDNDCGNNEICQNGECVPQPPECTVDGDCDDNEACQDGVCFCPEIEDGRCIRRCEVQNDCPGASSCRNLSPEDSPFIEDGVCVDEPFFLCDVASCTVNNDCDNDEVCVMLTCEGFDPVGRCHPFSVF